MAADELSASADSDLNHFADAAAAYRDALALKPNDPALTFALSRAYYRVHDYPAMAATALDYIRLKPQDANGYDELGSRTSARDASPTRSTPTRRRST